MNASFFIILLAVILLNSCSSANESETALGDELFPLEIGNYWTYKEVFISNDTSYSDYSVEYTITVKAIEEIIDYEWYKLEIEGNGVTCGRYLMVENDNKIYELQHNRAAPVRSLTYIIPFGSKQSFSSLLGGDVIISKTAYALDTLLITNVGTFSKCYKYEYSTPDWTEREFLVPGIGLVEKQMIGYDFITKEQKFIRVEKIIDYEVK